MDLVAGTVRRERLERRLDGAFAHRLTAVVADLGFGKTTLLRAWTEQAGLVGYSLTEADRDVLQLARGIVGALRLRVPGLPARLRSMAEADRGPDTDTDAVAWAEAFASALSAALEPLLQRNLVVAIDDLDAVADVAAPVRLIDALVRQAPPAVHLVVVGRSMPPFPVERLRQHGELLQLHGSDLAFTSDELAELLRATIGEEAARLAGHLHTATGGWPIAARFAVETLRHVPIAGRRAAIDALGTSGRPLFERLARDVLDREPAEVVALLEDVAVLERATPDLCVALGHAEAPELLVSLLRRGLFVEGSVTHPGWLRLAPPARQVLAELRTPDPETTRRTHRNAAKWLLADGEVELALASLVAAGDTRALRSALGEHGEALVSSGRTEVVLAAIDRVPDPRSELAALAGHALQARGDWQGALARYAAAAGEAGPIDPGIAWRMGLIHHLRGELDEALEVYGRGQVGSGSADDALLLAWSASARWLRGEGAACRELATRALRVATDADDPRALAAAHTALAMVAALDGDRRANDAHYLRALDHAERARDALQLIRIRTNRASHHLEEGAYGEALAELEIAIELSDLAGFSAFRALALSNRAGIELSLGRIEEAIADANAAIALLYRLDSRMVSYPLLALARARELRGDRAAAQRVAEEAVARAEEGDDHQALVPGLALLARLAADADPPRASELAERAIGLGHQMGEVVALNAAAGAALANGDPAGARRHARAAAEAAAGRRDRAGFAEALYLQALAHPDDAAAIELLERATGAWRELGHVVGVAQADLARARRSARPVALEVARRVRDRMQVAGARSLVAQAEEVIAHAREADPAPVTIRLLGGFEVLVAGQALGAGAWQSRKARDLLKLLVTRRGRPVPREVLIDVLWPDEEAAPAGGEPEDLAAKLSGRLSVLLSTLRGVLDPERSYPSDRFVAGDEQAIRLVLDAVDVDVEAFLDEAATGLRLWQEGSRLEAVERLRLAEARYRGDLLEEDVYEDWAVAPREQARAAYARVLRTLADAATAVGDHDTATRFLLRLLEQDAYDEPAHLALVEVLSAAGRHGEARRRYRLYSERMEELEVEAAPFPKGLPPLS